MLYPIGTKIKESIAEVAEEELKECFPGKVDKVKVIENADGFFLKVVGSISSAELENFMLNFFSRKGNEMAMEVKKKEESSLGLNDVVGGILGQAIQKQIADSLNEQMPAIIEAAQQKVNTIVSDFSKESSEKLKGLDSVIDQKFSQYTKGIDDKVSDAVSKASATEKAVNTVKETLKATGKVLVG